MVPPLSVSLVGFSSTTSFGSLSCVETPAAPVKHAEKFVFEKKKKMKSVNMKEMRNFDMIIVHLETSELLSFHYQISHLWC